MTIPFEVITIWSSLSLMLTPVNTCTLSFPTPSLYGTNYHKRLLMPLLFTRLKMLSHHTFIPHSFDNIIPVFIAVRICRMYTCISFFLLFVHPLLVKHKSYKKKKQKNKKKPIFRITRCLNFQQLCRPTCLSIQNSV